MSCRLMEQNLIEDQLMMYQLELSDTSFVDKGIQTDVPRGVDQWVQTDISCTGPQLIQTDITGPIKEHDYAQQKLLSSISAATNCQQPDIMPVSMYHLRQSDISDIMYQHDNSISMEHEMNNEHSDALTLVNQLEETDCIGKIHNLELHNLLDDIQDSSIPDRIVNTDNMMISSTVINKNQVCYICNRVFTISCFLKDHISSITSGTDNVFDGVSDSSFETAEATALVTPAIHTQVLCMLCGKRFRIYNFSRLHMLFKVNQSDCNIFPHTNITDDKTALDLELDETEHEDLPLMNKVFANADESNVDITPRNINKKMCCMANGLDNVDPDVDGSIESQNYNHTFSDVRQIPSSYAADGMLKYMFDTTNDTTSGSVSFDINNSLLASEPGSQKTQKFNSGTNLIIGRGTVHNQIPLNQETTKEQAKRYICTHCSKTFAYASQLACHMVTHTGDKSHVCVVCNKGFGHKSALNKHILIHTGKVPESSHASNDNETNLKSSEDCLVHQSALTGVRDHPCYSCNSTFSSTCSLKRHMKTHIMEKPHQLLHTGDKQYSCSKCDKKFHSERYLKRHIKLHSDEKPYACSVCGRRFVVLGYLKRHELIHTEQGPYVCSTCGQGFKSIGRLTSHEVSHTVDRPYSCSICDKRFCTIQLLSSHSSTHMEKKPFGCSLCKKRFSQSGHLTMHIRTHTGVKPYKCDVDLCDKSFSTSQRLKIHKRYHTGDRPYCCTTCGKRFIESSSFNLHNLRHIGDKPHHCSLCDKSFLTKFILSSHMRLHAGEKRHSCSVCGRKFAKPDHVRRHMKTHTREKPYNCTFCDKSFATRDLLAIHTRVHTGERPHSCSICDKSFYKSSNLKEHLRTHTGENPYICVICGASFRYSRTFNKHKMSHV